MSKRAPRHRFPGKPRLGLCCQFFEEPIKFRSTTAASLKRLSKKNRLEKLGTLCEENALSLKKAFEYCHGHGIGGFRVLSPILPLKTHPDVGYDLKDLRNGEAVIKKLEAAGEYAQSINLHLTFHPDQFVVLNSLRPEVVENSIREVDYQAEVAEMLGAEVINIHAGAAYGNKSQSLERLRAVLNLLPARVRQRVTLENDDRIYTPEDLLPVCQTEGIPLVYDVHHHRCNPDSLRVSEATDLALSTWNRTPVFHLSSPKEGWKGPKPERHHDFIDPLDFPVEWRRLEVLVEVEAKAKERAVLALQSEIDRFKGNPTSPISKMSYD